MKIEWLEDSEPLEITIKINKSRRKNYEKELCAVNCVYIRIFIN